LEQLISEISHIVSYEINAKIIASTGILKISTSLNNPLLAL